MNLLSIIIASLTVLLLLVQFIIYHMISQKSKVLQFFRHDTRPVQARVNILQNIFTFHLSALNVT